MTGKPTPGPWRYDENGYLRGSDDSFVGAFHEGRNDRRQRAVPKKVDRALILAAPELMETLRRMDRMHELMMRDVNHKQSAYQAETLREMNEAPLQTQRLLDRLTKKEETDDAAE